MFSNFKNYNIFISGAYGYIGSEISRKLCEAGAHVFINGRDKNKLNKLYHDLKQKDYKVTKALFDINDTKKVKIFFKKIKTLHVVINNASSGLQKKFNDFKDEDYLNAYKIAVLSTANIMKYSEKSLIAGAKEIGTTSVINISSMYGLVSPDFSIYRGTKMFNSPYYGSSKAALIQYTKYAAVYYAKKKIRVNSVSLGPFPNVKISKISKLFLNRLKAKVPLNRIGSPKDIISSIIFLSSKESSFVTGSNITVDGGWTAR